MPNKTQNYKSKWRKRNERRYKKEKIMKHLVKINQNQNIIMDTL
jgi:hypothetical protein